MQTNTDSTIISTRTFNFPIEKVFRAWAEPVHLKKWWGPKGFTNTFHEHDLRPGGKWKFTMQGPEGGNYENECVFATIEPPHLLIWDRLSKPIFRVHVSFEEQSGKKTKIIFRMIFEDSREYDTIRKFAPEKNEENFDRLEKVLEKM
jgi:uncharacterized protein YndB with AHSA1/START domain